MPNLATTGEPADLSTCHVCRIKSPNLQILDSDWRLVPLCPRCLPRILSASACSYCFQTFDTDDTRILRCRRCSRRIHLHCAPILRGYATLSELDADQFDCTDCCPIIRPRPRRNTNSGISLQDLAAAAAAAAEKRRAMACHARETAAVKAEAAGRKGALAKTMMEAVVTGNRHEVVSDEKLALQLHLEMNGSRRTRNTRKPRYDVCASSKRARCNDNSVIKKVGCVNYDSCENVGFSTEDRSYLDFTEETCRQQIFSVELDSIQKKYRASHSNKPMEIDRCNGGSSIIEAAEKGVDRCSRSTLGEVLVQEGQGSCSQSSAIEMDLDEKNDIEGFGIADLVEVVVNEDHENCDQSSSSIKLDCFEKVETKVNLVEVFVKEQHNEMSGHRESNLVEVPVIEDQDDGRCDQSSSSVKLDCVEHDQKKVSKCSNLLEVLVTDQPNSIKVYEESNLGELNDTLVRSELRIHASKDYVESQQKRCEVRDRYMKKYSKRRRGSNLVDLHVNEGHGIRDQCSSSVKLDCIEKVQNKVTKGCRNSNLVEKHLMNEIHGYMQSNLVEVSVNKNHGSHDQRSIKLDCTDNQKSVTNAHIGSNLVEVVVKEHEKILKGSSSIEVESNVTNYQEGMNGCINISLVSVPVEEQGRFPKSIGPVSVSCQSIGKLNDSLVESEFRVRTLNDSMESQPKRCDVPDRYMKKYSKRRSHMKGIMDRKESRLVPCVQTCSSELSRSLSSMHSSPHTRLPGHR